MEEETPSQIILLSTPNLFPLPPHLSSLLPFLQAHFQFSHLHPKNAPQPQSPHLCASQQTLAGEKFLWYTPRSGFNNQLSEFKYAILLAAILNQTLIVPPVLDHRAVVLGSCPKFRVESQPASFYCLEPAHSKSQPGEQLKKKKKISYVGKRRDAYQTLRPGSRDELATVLAFGSLFTAPYKGSELYVDIHESSRDQTMQSLIEKLSFLPFVPEIMSAGKEFASKTIKSPFLCAQLRLLDAVFKNHWKTTFLGLQQKIEFLRHEGPLPIHIFVMTNLPQGNWTGSYLEDLSRDLDAFKLHVLREKDELVTRTAKNLAAAAKEMKFGFLSKSLDRMKKN